MKAFARAVLAGAFLAGTAAFAAPAPHRTPSLTAAAPTDVSTAKRKPSTIHRTSRHRVHRRYGYRAPLYGPPMYGAPSYGMWRGADPSYGPGTAQMRAYQAMGVCVIDEGYGRFTFCNNR